MLKMNETIIQKFMEFCRNGNTPLSLQRLIKENANPLELDDIHVLWFEKYIHRVRDIVRSEPGQQTLYAFKDKGTHTSYSIKKLYKNESYASYRDWLEKLEEIKLLCRFDQQDDLKKWGKKKVYALNPDYIKVTKIILDVIHKTYYAVNI